ncbi:MAG: cytochrome c3 family protein [Anaerolineales bacterium]|nr:cytochrome c3 family protein [Anaerolineales bacterium]MBP6209792.1 cytochrome c3 family protein [Anaerolineales bacterium]
MRQIQSSRPRVLFRASLILLMGLFFFAYAVLSFPTSAQAAPVMQDEKPADDFCLACHQEEGLDFKLGKDVIAATINPTQFGNSVHAGEEVGCTDCHADISDYPHPKVKSKNARDFSFSLFVVCKDCHEDQFLKAQDSVHQKAIDEGNLNAAICTDCHNPHTQGRLTGQTSGELTPSARIHVPETCAQCHSGIYDAYKFSVHGNALIEEGNMDVPTCIDCHGVHNIQSPTTVSFRNTTPYLCAECHTDASIMDKYGISTNVLDSYVADFHGTTVKLFEEEFPGQPTNKPVCTDCHGVHNISKVSNPQTGVALKDNLLQKCQRCHPDATANFSAAWMSHYDPSPEHYPIVYAVNLFYKFFIPAVLGGMIFFVLTDIYRRIVNRIKGVKHA